MVNGSFIEVTRHLIKQDLNTTAMEMVRSYFVFKGGGRYLISIVVQRSTCDSDTCYFENIFTY